MGRATRILFSFPARPVPVPANRSQRPPLRPFLGRDGESAYAGVAHTSRFWRCVRPDARTQTSKPDVCATPCEPPRHRNRAVATRSSLVKKRRSQTSKKRCLRHPVNLPRHRNRAGATRLSLVKKRRSHADIKTRRLSHPVNLPRHRNRAGATRSSLVKKRGSQTSKSDVCATL